MLLAYKPIVSGSGRGDGKGSVRGNRARGEKDIHVGICG